MKPSKVEDRRITGPARRLTRNQMIASAAGTLSLLDLLSRADEPQTLAELVTASGRPKGTVHRMACTLVNTGFATYERSTGRYALTLKSWRIGSTAIRNFGLVPIAQPILDLLRAETGEAVHLSVMEALGEIIYVARLASKGSAGPPTWVGQAAPAWCTATGRSILAFHERMANEVLGRELEAYTPRTITDPNQLRQLLLQVRQQGYSVAQAEHHPELGGVAAPIHDHEGNVIAAVGVAVPVRRLGPQTLEQMIPSVCRAAGEISLALGYGLPTPWRRINAPPVQPPAIPR